MHGGVLQNRDQQNDAAKRQWGEGRACVITAYSIYSILFIIQHTDCGNHIIITAVNIITINWSRSRGSPNTTTNNHTAQLTAINY